MSQDDLDAIADSLNSRPRATHGFNTPLAVFAHMLAIAQQALAAICIVPDDCIDPRRYPLFMARDVMRGLIEQFKAETRTAP